LPVGLVCPLKLEDDDDVLTFEGRVLLVGKKKGQGVG
jgi:hypothetical protein